MNCIYKKGDWTALWLMFVFFFSGITLISAKPPKDSLKVGVSGSAPFVESIDQQTGISLEIWQSMAGMGDFDYKLISYQDVSDALTDLKDGELDAVVGPISITPDRAKYVRFTQPYYQTGLSIMSRTESPTVLQRLSLLVSKRFFYAVLGFLGLLAFVGFLFWLAERHQNPDEFSSSPLKGTGDGMWCAIVTMTTTGYGDIAPRTLNGRVIAGCWMVICIAFATTMVAGISSTLALSASNVKTISKAEELNDQKVAVVKNAPAADFVEKYGAQKDYVATLREGYEALKNNKVEAVVFDRPQMLYFLQNHKSEDITISSTQYMRQGYGFALPLGAEQLHPLNIDLLRLQESGRINRIVTGWLGKDNE